MPRTEWLELIADYRCNQRCEGCYSVDENGPSMQSREALETLAWGRRQGADKLWLGGGDPTLRRDLFGLVEAARRMGYVRVKLQTNGMLLAYERYAQRCCDAGVTEVAFSLKGHDAPSYERLTNTPGSHALLVQGIANARAVGLGCEGDLLVYRSTAGRTADAVRAYHALGVERFRVWLFSGAAASGDERARLQGEVPRLSDAVRGLCEAVDLGLSDAPDFLVSLHTPPCTVPVAYHRVLFYAPDLGLLVANPGAHRFRLEDSPMEGGTYFDTCAGCPFRRRCGGARDEYVRLFGREEFTPPT